MSGYVYRFERYVNIDVMRDGVIHQTSAGWRVVCVTLDWDEYYLVTFERSGPR